MRNSVAACAALFFFVVKGIFDAAPDVLAEMSF